jgi:hypothetical protein
MRIGLDRRGFISNYMFVTIKVISTASNPHCCVNIKYALNIIALILDVVKDKNIHLGFNVR